MEESDPYQSLQMGSKSQVQSLRKSRHHFEIQMGRLAQWTTVWPVNKESPLYRKDNGSVHGEMLGDSIMPYKEVTS